MTGDAAITGTILCLGIALWLGGLAVLWYKVASWLRGDETKR